MEHEIEVEEEIIVLTDDSEHKIILEQEIKVEEEDVIILNNSEQNIKPDSYYQPPPKNLTKCTICNKKTQNIGFGKLKAKKHSVFRYQANKEVFLKY